jgi:plastocyanin
VKLGRSTPLGLAVLVLVAAACGSSGGGAVTAPSATASSATGGSPTATSQAGGGACATLAGLSGAVEDHGSVALSGDSIEIDAGDFFFDPTCVTASSSGTISVTVTNTGNALHNLTVSDQGIDKDVQVGDSITVKVKLPRSGSLPFLCKYHSASGMQGAFVIG